MPQSQCNGVQGSEGCVGGAFPQGSVMHHNLSAGIIVSNQSLVLQRVGRERAGRYYCRATNLHGEGVSAPIAITIMCMCASYCSWALAF